MLNISTAHLAGMKCWFLWNHEPWNNNFDNFCMKLQLEKIVLVGKSIEDYLNRRNFPIVVQNLNLCTIVRTLILNFFPGYLFECYDLWHTNYMNQRPYLMLLHSAMWLFILFCSNSDVQELNYSKSPRLGGHFSITFLHD